MDKAYFWTAVVLMGAVTLSIRVSFFYLYSYIKIPTRVKTSLAFIPLAVLPALAAPAAFFHKGDVFFVGGYERTLAFLFASVVCYKTKNVLLTIVSGLIFLYLIKLAA